MRTFLMLVGALATTIALAACGGDDDKQTSTTPSTEQAPATEAGPAEDEASAGQDTPTGDDSSRDDASRDAPTEDDSSRDDSSRDDSSGDDAGEDDSGDAGTGDAADTDTDADAAGAAVVAFFKAMSTGDGEEACSLMADQVRRQIEKGVAQSPQFKGKGCADLVSALAKNYPDATRDQLADVELVKTRVKGDTVFVTYKGGIAPEATMPVVEDDGTWKIGAATGSP